MQHSEVPQKIAALSSAEPAAAFRTGIELLRADHCEELLPVAHHLARKYPSDARIRQLLGLAARGTGDSAAALAAFRKAAELAPTDALIAHSHARAALEAGQPASALFDRAARLAPTDGSVLLGRAASHFHEGRSDLAMEQLEQLLDQNPLWTDGHRDLAHLRGQLGLPPLAAIDAAIARLPNSPDLHRLRIALALEARDLASARAAIDSALGALGNPQWLAALAGHVASEAGDLAEADRQFAHLHSHEIADASLYARHLLRAGRPESAASLLEPLIDHDREHLLWPYLSLAWRLTGDPRWSWLEGAPDLVGVYDLAEEIGDIAALADLLRGLHTSKEAPLDQSVRGGTQTDGNLLLRIDPKLRQLRQLLLRTVARHVERLPPPAPHHPTLIAARKPLRIAGSWSVRLRDQGFHADHVHGMGWFSSALYLVLPPTLGRDGARPADHNHAGWLSLGECRDIVPGLAPTRLVEPRPGRLVLFPSTMWHGTRPFEAGERITIAFDIARPRQG